jgi:hypothetical protein
MKHYALLATAILVFSVMLECPCFAEQRVCEPRLPLAIQRVLQIKYPDFEVLTASDLNPDDRETWSNAYPHGCPGTVSGKFKGDSTEFAVALVRRGKDQGKFMVVLFSPSKEGAMSEALYSESAQANLPVIRKAPPGKYDDVDGKAHLRASRDVILVEHLESSVTALIFKDGHLQELHLAE